MERRASQDSYKKTSENPTSLDPSFNSLETKAFRLAPQTHVLSLHIFFRFILFLSSLKLGLVVDIIILQTPVQTKLHIIICYQYYYHLGMNQPCRFHRLRLNMAALTLVMLLFLQNLSLAWCLNSEGIVLLIRNLNINYIYI